MRSWFRIFSGFIAATAVLWIGCSNTVSKNNVAFKGTWLETLDNTTHQVITDGHKFKLSSSSVNGTTTIIYDGDQLYNSSTQSSKKPSDVELQDIKFWEIGDFARKNYSIKEMGTGEDVCGRQTSKVQTEVSGFTFNELVDKEKGLRLKTDGLNPHVCQQIEFGTYDASEFTRPS